MEACDGLRGRTTTRGTNEHTKRTPPPKGRLTKGEALKQESHSGRAQSVLQGYIVRPRKPSQEAQPLFFARKHMFRFKWSQEAALTEINGKDRKCPRRFCRGTSRQSIPSKSALLRAHCMKRMLASTSASAILYRSQHLRKRDLDSTASSVACSSATIGQSCLTCLHEQAIAFGVAPAARLHTRCLAYNNTSTHAQKKNQ